MKTLILLIDFYGHPALTTDRYNDNIRYSALTEIISSSFIDRTNCAIFSTSIPQNDERLLELKKMAILKGFPFVTPIPGTNDVPWDEIYSIDYIKSKLKDGEYKVGIRPHNITTYKEGSNSLEISGKVLISELSGSESLIHFTNGDLNWVSLSNGIHQKNVGEQTKLFMNSDEFLYFDESNKLVNNV